MQKATIVTSTKELEQILFLQEANLPGKINETEMQQEGFVTLRHDLATLQQMHRLAPGIIIKDNNEVIGYALTMLRECRLLIPDLEPMFLLFDKLNWKEKPLNSYRFYVMGQVCIAKEWRGKGLFEQLYLQHRKVYQPEFDLIVTEISTKNLRSVKAHEKVGFKTIYTHRDNLDEWVIVAWDWN